MVIFSEEKEKISIRNKHTLQVRLTSEMINSDKYKHTNRQYRTLPVVLDSIFSIFYRRFIINTLKEETFVHLRFFGQIAKCRRSPFAKVNSREIWSNLSIAKVYSQNFAIFFASQKFLPLKYF